MLVIAEYIPKGKSNAVTRQMLSVMTGMTDRAVRKEISKARATGVPIVSSSHSAGYYIAETNQEKEIILRELASRMAALATAYRAIAKTMVVEGQLAFEDEIAFLAGDMLVSSAEYLGGAR